MRIRALMKRIIQQFKHDKRTLALLFLAPIFALTLLWVVLDMDNYEPVIAVTDLPNAVVEQLENEEATIKIMTANEAQTKLSHDEIDAWLSQEDETMLLNIEGSDPTATKMVKQVLTHVSANMSDTSIDIETNFLHGSSDLGVFDNSGPAFIGFFIFFFVFLLSGVTFLRERTQGTLERLLATPLKRTEIVLGYLAGFGIFILIQALIIVLYTIYVLGMYMEGSIINVLIITFLLAFMAQSLGTFLSAFAKNEFQMIQFIPLVIVPQVFFSGIFQTEQVTWIHYLSKIMPLTYGSEALKEIMLRGANLSDLYLEITVMLGFFILFLTMNIVALKRYRKT